MCGRTRGPLLSLLDNAVHKLHIHLDKRLPKRKEMSLLRAEILSTWCGNAIRSCPAGAPIGGRCRHWVSWGVIGGSDPAIRAVFQVAIPGLKRARWRAQCWCLHCGTPRAPQVPVPGTWPRGRAQGRADQLFSPEVARGQRSAY